MRAAFGICLMCLSGPDQIFKYVTVFLYAQGLEGIWGLWSDLLWFVSLTVELLPPWFTARFQWRIGPNVILKPQSVLELILVASPHWTCFSTDSQSDICPMLKSACRQRVLKRNRLSFFTSFSSLYASVTSAHSYALKPLFAVLFTLVDSCSIFNFLF